MAGRISLWVHAAVALFFVVTLQHGWTSAAYAYESVLSEKLISKHYNDDERQVSKSSDISSFLDVSLKTGGGDCGTCVEKLGLSDGSCHGQDPLKYCDIFLDAHEDCITNCHAIVEQLRPMCCPTAQSGLASHCSLFFGTSGCSSMLQQEAVVTKHDNNDPKGAAFLHLQNESEAKDTPPPAACMSDCGCRNDGSCSGSSFNSLTCCSLQQFISNACLNCISCQSDPNKCDVFTTAAPTSAPTTAPTSAPTPAPTTAPTAAPTTAPTSAPTPAPTTAPTSAPSTQTPSPPTPGGPRLMSDFLTKDQLCDMFGVQRWWYPTGGKEYDPNNCHQTNYTLCKPPDSFWGSYGPEGRYLDFWDQSHFSGTTSWTRLNDREDCLKAVEILLQHVDAAITLLRGKDSNKFNKLFNNGNEGMDRLEVAAFWAHVSTETGGLSDFYESVTDPTQQSIYGQYFGRGPLQLSYQPNYQAFSDFMGDPSIMSNPDKLIDDPVTMWASGLWFWMYDATFDVWSNKDAIGQCPMAHKGSMHWAITEGPGFGLSIAILNGAVECNPHNVQGGQKRWEKMNSRVRYLLWNMHIMHLAPPNTQGLIVDKKNERGFWTASFVELPDFFTEGCPPIHEGKDKLKCKGQLQKFGYDPTRYGHDDLKKGPFYAGWNGGGLSFDTNMGFKTYFDAPYPWVQSADAVGYVQRWQTCDGVAQTVYSGGHYTCTENICSANPKKHLWILKSVMRYQCDNTPTGDSMPSTCPAEGETWPQGKWKTDGSAWPNTYLQGYWKAPDENYVDDQDEPGTAGEGGDDTGTGSATNQRPESDFADRHKIRDLLSEVILCDACPMRWYYPNGEVNSQVCEICGPRDLFPSHTPPLRIEDIYVAKEICSTAQVPSTGDYTTLSDLWNVCRQSAQNTDRPNGNVESEWGVYSAEGQYSYQYGRLQQRKEPWTNVSAVMDVFTFIEKHWNNKNDREICEKKAAKYALDDMESALKEVRKRSSRYDKLFDNGNIILDKIEIAAFMAHVFKETGCMSEWVESVNGNETLTYGNGNIMCDPNSEYKCVQDVWYNGRGPLQITWNFNYGKFSKFWNGDQTVFLKNPEMLVRNPTIGWGSAFWFWFETHEFDVWSHTMGTNVCPLPHKGSMHDAITRSVGFGLSIAIINGQVECSPYNGDYQRKTMPLARLRYFVFNLWLLKIPVPQNIIYDKKDFWDADFVPMPKYFYEGCPLIGIDAKKANRACIPKCKAFEAKLGYYQDEAMCVESYSPGEEIKGCPNCTAGITRNQLLGAVKCGYNLNDPTSFVFELPWPSVGSLEALNYTPEGFAYCQLVTGTHNGKQYYFPRTFSTDCMLQDGMCVYATDGTTRLGKYMGANRSPANEITSVRVEDCPGGNAYCCYDNSHKHLTRYTEHTYSEYVLWHPDPLLRFQCDHCSDECEGGPCKAPEEFSCPTGQCGEFSPTWPDGDWNSNREEWPNIVLTG